MSNTAKAAVIQMNSGAERDANLEAAALLLRQAAEQGAQLAVLPENFALMGNRESDKLAIAEADGSGPIQDFLSQTAQALGLWIVGGTIPLAVPGDTGHVHAACCVWNAQGQRVARYDKIHLFDVEVPGPASRGHPHSASAPRPVPPPAEGESRPESLRDERASREQYRESATIAAGSPQALVVDTPLGRLGLSVCYDLRFPELYRALAGDGAELLCVPSAFTERTGRAHWELLLRARAVENLCYVLAADQCGSHAAGRRTWGRSCIVEPWGGVLAGCEDAPGVAVAEIDIDRQRELRRGFPALAHRRM